MYLLLQIGYAVRLPAFTRRKSEVINGTGNAVVPEGTRYLGESMLNRPKKLNYWCKIAV
jgi:hypothetical protein